jgi:glycosyltransferase involved in cell wall biosynthesis
VIKSEPAMLKSEARTRIAYVTTYDSNDIENWSGSGYFISKTLEKQCGELVRIGPLHQYSDRPLRIKHAFYRYILRRGYFLDRTAKVLKSYADEVARRLNGANVDLVFSPGTLPICYLKTTLPIVFWTDATVAGLIDFYPDWFRLCDATLRDAKMMEQAALSNCRLAIYTSSWAADTAIQNYKVDASKVKVVPFGANLECVADRNQLQTIIAQKPSDVCKLLFIGTNWYRKGGDIAVAVAKSLNASGLKTQLTVLGCDIKGSVPECVLSKGFVSKKTSDGRALIYQLFIESHFLVVPSRADCVPVAIAEAASFGVPVVAANVGGISTAVTNNFNGYILPSGPEFVMQACRVILTAMQTPATYRQLAVNSLAQYEDRLNWQSAGFRVQELLNGVLA